MNGPARKGWICVLLLGCGVGPSGCRQPVVGDPHAGSAAEPVPRSDAGLEFASPREDGGRSPDENAESVLPSLPADIRPGVLVDEPVSRDRAALVAHAGPATRRALVYLHGVCGNIHAVTGWAEVASKLGTLIALRGDRACDVPGKYRWSSDIALIDIRIDRALDAIKTRRNGALDAHGVVLIGYSQGATRAADLVQKFPKKYERLVVAGSPVAARADREGLAKLVAVVAGEREQSDHMLRGYEVLAAAGTKARYFTLPRAGHGEYGPQGAEVMHAVLSFVSGE